MKPTMMRDILDTLCHQWGIEKKVKECIAIEKWYEVVGGRVARETKPLGIKNGKLFLRVENASWRNELTFMKREIIDKLNRSVGTNVVRDIIFSVGKGANREK